MSAHTGHKCQHTPVTFRWCWPSIAPIRCLPDKTQSGAVPRGFVMVMHMFFFRWIYPTHARCLEWDSITYCQYVCMTCSVNKRIIATLINIAPFIVILVTREIWDRYSWKIVHDNSYFNFTIRYEYNMIQNLKLVIKGLNIIYSNLSRNLETADLTCSERPVPCSSCLVLEGVKPRVLT